MTSGKRDGVLVALEATNAYIETMDQRLTDRLEALTVQVGQLTESLTEAKNLLTASADRRDAQIDRLMGIVEALIRQP